MLEKIIKEEVYWYGRFLYETNLLESLNKISPQTAHDKNMFGPVYHGTTQENFQKISQDGFKVFVGAERSDNVRHGYPDMEYYGGYPPPIHHLGYGIYFTTVKSVGKMFNRDEKGWSSGKNLKEFYLDVPKLEVINFASPKTMMMWWLDNGYDGDLAVTGTQGRIDATIKLTKKLKSLYDAVWFKGKTLYRVLDGDQVCVFNPENIYMVDYSLSNEMEIGSKVVRVEADVEDERIKNLSKVPPGTVGVILGKKSTKEMQDQWDKNRKDVKHWSHGSDFVYTIKWKKGGTEYSVLDFHIKPYKRWV